MASIAIKEKLTTMRDEDYKLLRDSYYGDNGFLDGSRIAKHPRETDQKLRSRREIAYFLNYVAPVVNSHVSPIFAKPHIRDWKTTNALLSAFVEDVDLERTEIKQFMKSAAVVAKLFGTVYIVVDNFQDGEQPARLNDAANDRILPYAYLVHPKDVIAIEGSRTGGIEKFSYYDGKDDDGNRLVREWTREGWSLKVGGSDGEILSQGSHGLGVVPVVPLHSRKSICMDGVGDGRKPQTSEFLSIARANLRIFNLCSELDEILRNQTFSILTYPSKDPRDLTIGTDSALGFDGEVLRFAPAFIAPPSDPAKLIMEQIDRLIKEIYRMAMLTHATGVSEATSGIAKAYDYERTNQTLADFAGNLQEAERRIIEIFGVWIGQDIEYNVQYPDDFGITDTEQEIRNAVALLDMNLNAQFVAAVKKRVARVMLANDPESDFDAVITEINNEITDAEYGDRLENPSAAQGGDIAVGVASGVIDLLTKVGEGAIAPDAAKILLVATFGLSEAAADAAIKSQMDIASANKTDVEMPTE